MTDGFVHGQGAALLDAAGLSRLLPLYAGRGTYKIARSCCEGLVPCRAYVDNAAAPSAAVVALARLGIAFAAGDARHAPALLAALHGWHPWYEVNDPADAWQPALAAWSKESYATPRYAFTNDPHALDVDRLRRLAVPPPGYALQPYDRALLGLALSEPWSEDQAGAFESPEAFLRDGMGMALLHEGRLVSGCASFCRHADGFEIQVDTHPDYQGKGLATCVSAAFMLEALRRGMTPCWDAANSRSLRLAEKLGFVFEKAFTAWLLIAPQVRAEEVAAKVVGSN